MTSSGGAAVPRRGEIWSVLLPNQPEDIHKPRPGLIVSVDVRNRLAGDVTVVPLSTTLRPLATHVMISAQVSGLRQNSMAKCEQVTTLDKRFLGTTPIGRRLPDSLLNDVVRAIRRAIGETLPTA